MVWFVLSVLSFENVKNNIFIGFVRGLNPVPDFPDHLNHLNSLNHPNDLNHLNHLNGPNELNLFKFTQPFLAADHFERLQTFIRFKK